jgi:hypothetical protein
MKSIKLAFAAVAALALAACATAPGGSAVQAPSPQAAWYTYCAAYNAAQPQILAHIPTAPKATVAAVVPLSDKIAAECEGPMPVNTQAAVTELATDVTQVLIQLGLQKFIPAQPQAK